MLHNADNGEDLYNYYQEMLNENIKKRDQVELIHYVEAAKIVVLRKILGKGRTKNATIESQSDTSESSLTPGADDSYMSMASELES